VLIIFIERRQNHSKVLDFDNSVGRLYNSFLADRVWLVDEIEAMVSVASNAHHIDTPQQSLKPSSCKQK